MLKVKTRIAPSQIHGYGLFAGEFIPAGKVVWEYVEGFDRKISEEDVAAFPPEARKFIQHFCGLLESGHYLVTADDDRFINHSADDPNTVTDAGAMQLIALRDIQLGEEITEDYRWFDVTW